MDRIFRRRAGLLGAAALLLAQASPAAAALVQIDPTYASETLPINISTIDTTEMVAANASFKIFVTHWDLITGGTGNGTWVYGTGTKCGTGQHALTGPYPLTAQAGLSVGNGAGTVLKVPKGNALCFISSAAVQYSGSFTYQQS